MEIKITQRTDKNFKITNILTELREYTALMKEWHDSISVKDTQKKKSDCKKK